MCNLNSQVSGLYLHHLCLSMETLYSLSAKKFRTRISCCWAFFSSGEQISRSSTYFNSFPLGPRSRSRRCQLKVCPNRWGLSLNLWGNTVQVICWCFPPGASHSKVKRYWGSLASGMQKKCIFEIQDCKPLGTGWNFSQDYIGIGYSGMEGDYRFIYDSEILNHLPGSVLLLYWEDWGVIWQIGGDQ